MKLLKQIGPMLLILVLSQLSNAQRSDQSASSAADFTASSPGTWDNHPPCSTNKECIAAHGGEPYICQKVTRTCVRLTSSECILLAEESDISDDNTVWVGLVTNMTDRPLRPLSVDFARREFVNIGRGLPPANPGGGTQAVSIRVVRLNQGHRSNLRSPDQRVEPARHHWPGLQPRHTAGADEVHTARESRDVVHGDRRGIHRYALGRLIPAYAGVGRPSG